MADNYFSIIEDIRADAGLVTIAVRCKNFNETITITVCEALDRAAAIDEMTTESEVTQAHNKELVRALMDAAAEARAQQKKMADDGKYVDFALSNKNRRQLEIRNANKRKGV